MRHAFAAAVVLAAFLVLPTGLPGARAQGPPSLVAIENFSVNPSDPDGNGLIDALVGSFTATVSVAGNFRFQAQLLTSWGSLTTIINADVNLDVGAHPLSVSVPGPAVHLKGAAGPYDFLVVSMPVADDGTFVDNGPRANVTTPAYDYMDFEPPWAALGTPITDEGVDSDADGLYNALVVHVPVVVSRDGPVQVRGCLNCEYDYGNSEPTETLYLAAGAHSLDITWDGALLRQTLGATGMVTRILVALLLPGLRSDAPAVVNRSWYYPSRYYGRSQLQGPAARFATAAPTETRLDTNGNGKADFLVLHFALDVRVAGDYFVGAVVSIAWTSAVAYGGTFAHLLPGNRTVDVSLSGISLSRFPSGAVQGEAWVFPADPFVRAVDSSRWPLTDFSSADFESRPVSTLSITVTSSTPACSAYVYDPSQRFLPVGGFSVNTSAQSIAIDLYDGDFDVIVLGCGSPGASTVQKVSVSGATSIRVALPTPTPLSTRIAYDVPAWNETDVTTSRDMGYYSPVVRMEADFYGNADGIAEDSELRFLAARLGLAYPFYASPPKADNRSLPLASTQLAGLTGAGDIASTTPLAVTSRAVFRTANRPIPGDHHRLVLETFYSVPLYTFDLAVSASASAGGNLSVGSRMLVYDGDGFTWPANASAIRTGPRSWTIAVGGMPTEEPQSVLLEVVLDAYGAQPSRPANPLDILGGPLGVAFIIIAVASAVVYVALRRAGRPRTPR